MRVAVVDSGGANIASVMHALDRLGTKAEFTSDARTVRAADRVILPGVGSARAAMRRLESASLDAVIPALEQPVLGICLGMQLLFEHSEEGDVPLLGVLPGRVRRLPEEPGRRVPHMGWNRIRRTESHPLLDGLDDTWFYFVHSFAAPVNDTTLATSEHGERFSAVAGAGSFVGVQFHPERSADAGARLLENFLK